MTAGAGKAIMSTMLPGNAATTIYARGVDAVNNASCTNLVVYTHDNVAPLNVSFVRAGSQPSITNSVPVDFTATFSEAINAAGFTGADVSNAGTASAVSWSVIQVSPTVFTVRATAAGDGTLTPKNCSSWYLGPCG